MARVFLLNPPSPEPVRTPLLAFCHLASSLRAAGHQVALLDASAPFAPHDPDAITAHIASFAPDLVGLHLKTQHIQPAYALARHLRAALPETTALVAGGPHATICPDEPFGFGFRFVARGESEELLPELASALDGKCTFDTIAGLSFATTTRTTTTAAGLPPRHNPPRPFLSDLDALPSPLSALDLFDPAWYGATSTLPPAGMLSSRGCPAACSFCSNNVTGRKFRYRSAASVAAEVRTLRARFGATALSFFDDSFAVGRRRVAELCGALREAGPVHWTCTAHPAHLDREVLLQMKRAGCGGLDIGMESADPGMLLRIGKGVTVERVLDVLGWCRELGLHVIVNLMFGWPDETDAELGATLDFLEHVGELSNSGSGLAAGLNARGVVVPYPGTPLYDDNHARFGFTEWWLREPPLDYPPFPTAWSEPEVRRAYAADPALDRNFFHHPPHRLALIRRALERKAEITLALAQRRAGAPVAVPAAGAR